MGNDNRQGQRIAMQEQMLVAAQMQAEQNRQFMAANMLETARDVYVPLALDACREFMAEEKRKREEAEHTPGMTYSPPTEPQLDFSMQVRLAKVCANFFMRGPAAAAQPKAEAEQPAQQEEKKSPILTA